MNDSNPQVLTKTCSSCKEVKPKSDFYRLRSDVSSHCKQCNHKHRVLKTRENRKRAIDLLGGSCIQCGYNRCAAALHFHHPDPSLKKSITDFRYLRNRKWSTIEKELI